MSVWQIVMPKCDTGTGNIIMTMSTMDTLEEGLGDVEEYNLDVQDSLDSSTTLEEHTLDLNGSLEYLDMVEIDYYGDFSMENETDKCTIEVSLCK